MIFMFVLLFFCRTFAMMGEDKDVTFISLDVLLGSLCMRCTFCSKMKNKTISHDQILDGNNFVIYKCFVVNSLQYNVFLTSQSLWVLDHSTSILIISQVQYFCTSNTADLKVFLIILSRVASILSFCPQAYELKSVHHPREYTLLWLV